MRDSTIELIHLAVDVLCFAFVAGIGFTVGSLMVLALLRMLTLLT